ncbi:MAG: hypothetical protein DHS20C10_08380 [marine bacterium B5-7]|nr:MAG: hypothetical protein DHS20C10_08380 [marine bacterium B5-7]
MNAVARVLAQDALIAVNLGKGLITRRAIALTILMTMVLASAFGVIVLKDNQRRMVSAWQSEQMMQQHMKVQHSRLMLEQATWAAPSRVQMIASHELKMALPRSRDVVIVKS